MELNLGRIAVQGYVRLEFVNKETNEIENVIESPNLIPNTTLLQLIESSSPFSSIFSTSSKISISTYSAFPAYSISTIPNIISIGFIPSGVSAGSPLTFVDNSDPMFLELSSFIDISGTNRTFQTVLIVSSGTSSIAVTNQTLTALAYVRLDNVVTQLPTQFINIYYQIKFPYTGYNIKRWVLREIAMHIGSVYTGGLDYSFLGFSAVEGVNPALTDIEEFIIPPFSCTVNYISFGGHNDTGRGQGITAFSNSVRIDNHFKRKWTVDYNRRNLFSLGAIINSLYVGRSREFFRKRVIYHQIDSNKKGARYTNSNISRPPEPRQVSFWHVGSATSPFFETASSPSPKERGRMIWTGTWNKILPTMYRIEITSTGETGVASYRVHTKKHSGFLEDSYNSRVIPIPWRQSLITPASSKVHGMLQEDVYKWSETELLQWDTTGVTILNIWNGTYKAWDATTNPPLNATAINQVSPDNERGIIWVACRETGIWRINVTANTCIQLQSIPCFGVDLAGNDGIAIAVLDGRLADSSTDFVTSLPFNFPDINNGGWFKVRFIKGNRYSADKHIALVYEPSIAGTRTLLWWQPSSSTVTTTSLTSTALKHSGSIGNCPANPTWWAVLRSNKDIGNMTFGQSVVTNLVFNSTNLYPFGNSSSITFYKNSIITSTGVYTASVTPTRLYVYSSGGQSTPLSTLASSSNTCIHWEDGLCFVHSSQINEADTSYCGYLVQLLEGVEMGSNSAWVSYGWDGTNWTTASSNSKTTHVDSQGLIDGLSIAFTNRESGPANLSYVQNEYLTQPYNYGLLKSNAEGFSISYQLYVKNVNTTEIDILIPSSFTYTLPVITDVNYIRIETDSPDLHKLFINNISVTAIRTDGSAPAINEITIDGVTGVITFNANDVGKSFTGIYVWIGN